MIEPIGLTLNWQSASRQDFPSLSDSDLHLWWLPLILESHQAEQAIELLSDIQRDKYHRRMTPELKQAYLAGRYYLLSLLGHYSNCSPEKVELSYSRLNKPYLSNRDSHLEFNFTDTQHQGQFYGLFGFTKTNAIGVDLESRHRNIDLSKLITKRFTQEERAYVQKNKSIDRARGLSIWTRKEAYGKATGQGINFKMNEHNFAHQNANSASFNFIDTKKQPWRCLPLNLGDDFVASCVHESHSELTVCAFNSLKDPQN